MTFEQLLYTKVLSHQPSMQAAADILHISKSGLSLAITQLEEELGVKIFDRTKKGTALTPEGLQILSAITDVLRAKNELVNTALTVTSQQKYEIVKICYANKIPSAFIKVFLDEFKNEYPNVIVDMSQHQRNTILEKIRNEEVDAGFIPLPEELGDLGQELNFEPVCHTRIELICSKNNPIASKEKITLEDLKKMKFCMFNDDSYNYVFNQMQYMCGPLSIIFRSDDYEAIKNVIIEMEAVCLVRTNESSLSDASWLDEMHHFFIGHLIDDDSILAWVINTNCNLSEPARAFMNLISEKIKTDTK